MHISSSTHQLSAHNWAEEHLAAPTWAQHHSHRSWPVRPLYLSAHATVEAEAVHHEHNIPPQALVADQRSNQPIHPVEAKVVRPS